MRVNGFGARHVVYEAVGFCGGVHPTIKPIFRVAFNTVGIFVHTFQIQQACVQHAHRQIEPMLYGVQVNLVAQNVPVYRLQKRKTVGLQALEQVGAAKTHQTLASAAQVVDDLAFWPGCGLL